MLTDRRSVSPRNVATLLSLAMAGALGSAKLAYAEQRHVVQSGQSLAIIAKKYRSSVSELAVLNGIKPEGILREGQVLAVPNRNVVSVEAGQTLSGIAQAHHTTVEALASLNHISADAVLQIGQKLVVGDLAPVAGGKPGGSAKDAGPTAKAAVVDKAPGSSLKPAAANEKTLPSAPSGVSNAGHGTSGSPSLSKTAATTTAKATSPSVLPREKPKQRGVVSLFRIWSRESIQLRLVDSRGRPRPDARRAMRELLRPRDSKRRKMPNPRLLSLLAKVSDHFGGRPIHVVSGFRLPKGLTRKTSRHVAGDAIDFRIPGIPLTVLRDYCAKLPDVGVGYYPTTQFVHLDVRKQPARWTDWSLPGQPPVLTKPADLDENDKDELIGAPPHEGETTAAHKASEEDRNEVDDPTG